MWLFLRLNICIHLYTNIIHMSHSHNEICSIRYEDKATHKVFNKRKHLVEFPKQPCKMWILETIEGQIKYDIYEIQVCLWSLSQHSPRNVSVSASKQREKRDRKRFGFVFLICIVDVVCCGTEWDRRLKSVMVTLQREWDRVCKTLQWKKCQRLFDALQHKLSVEILQKPQFVTVLHFSYVTVRYPLVI
jgi:hypothetical protein